MNWLLLGGSLAGVFALALAAKLLGLGGGQIANEEEAMRIAEAELPGFIATSAIVADNRESAAVTGTDGAQVRLRRHGAQFVAERP